MYHSCAERISCSPEDIPARCVPICRIHICFTCSPVTYYNVLKSSQILCAIFCQTLGKCVSAVWCGDAGLYAWFSHEIFLSAGLNTPVGKFMQFFGLFFTVMMPFLTNEMNNSDHQCNILLVNAGSQHSCGCKPSSQTPIHIKYTRRYEHILMSLVLQRDHKSCSSRKTAQEQPEQPDKELKVSTWPQNPPDPVLIELHGTWLKINNPWSAVGMKGFTLSAAMFEWVLCVKEYPYKYQTSWFSTLRSYHYQFHSHHLLPCAPRKWGRSLSRPVLPVQTCDNRQKSPFVRANAQNAAGEHCALIILRVVSLSFWVINQLWTSSKLLSIKTDVQQFFSHLSTTSS